MTVYIVFNGDYLEAVFSTREMAERYIAEQNSFFYSSLYFIEECELNSKKVEVNK